MSNPDTQSDKTVEEILETLASGWRSWTHDQLDGTSFIEDELNEIEKTKGEAIAALTARENRIAVEAELRGFNKAYDSHDYDGLRAYRAKLEAQLTQTNKEN